MPVSMRLASGALLVACAVLPAALSSQQSSDSAARADSAFRAVQSRGLLAMGVDQYTSAHTFEPLPDGGRIALVREVEDSAGVDQIRSHLRHIAVAFRSGDFGTPAMVHDQQVPGTKVMAAKRDLIRYEFSPLPHGGQVRIITNDPEAIRAVHDFLAFQNSDHRAGADHQHQ